MRARYSIHESHKTSTRRYFPPHLLLSCQESEWAIPTIYQSQASRKHKLNCNFSYHFSLCAGNYIRVRTWEKKASVKSWFGNLFYFSVLIEIADFFVWCSKNASLKQGKIGKNKFIEENIDQNPGKDMKWSNAVMWRILLKKSKRHTWTKRATAYCKADNSAEWRSIIQAFSKPRWGWSFDKILQI